MKNLKFVMLILLAFTLSSCMSNARINEIKEITLAWARLAEYPSDARFRKIQTKGSMFTREFDIEFSASSPSLARWLSSSPGIKDGKIQRLKDNSLRYIIKPGAGAGYAEVVVSGTSVKIKTFWS